MINSYSPITGLSNSERPKWPPTVNRPGWALKELRRREAEEEQREPEPRTSGEKFAEWFESNIRRNPNDIFTERSN